MVILHAEWMTIGQEPILVQLLILVHPESRNASPIAGIIHLVKKEYK